MANEVEGGQSLLEIRNLSCSLDKAAQIFHDVNFVVREGDIIVLQGKSGCGKSTLQKCLAHLNVYGGDVLYRGKTPKQLGVPTYRTYVQYVPQRFSLLPGSPRTFLSTIKSFGALRQRERSRHSAAGPAEAGGHSSASCLETYEERAVALAEDWGVEPALWDRPWATVSGGEGQRIVLASAVALSFAEVLLLDEPTSALDADSCALVERYLVDMVRRKDTMTKALVMITHSAEQAQRLGTRFIQFVNGTCVENLLGGDNV